MKINMPFNSLKTGLHLRRDLIERIVNALHPISLITNNITELHLLMLGITNHDEVEIILEDPEFAPELKRELLNHGIKCRNDIVFKWSFVASQIDLPKHLIDLHDGYLLKITSAKVSLPVGQRAAIHILKGKGKTPVYELEAKPDLKYHIGQGENVQLSDGMFHTNQIIFKTVPDEIRRTNPNGYVSRFHALILFSKTENRLCLKTVKSNVTKIFRLIDGQQQIIDVNNALLEYPLEHNDQIQLGGIDGCMLQFSYMP